VELRGLEPLTSSMPSTGRPVWRTASEARGWSPAYSVDRDCASRLVSSLVISVVVKLTFSLRRLRLAAGRARCGRPSVHCVHPDHDHDVAGAHTGHTAASTAEPW
jgi:hypothetical protein